MVGHSLGAAQALLDAVFLPLHLPSGTKFKFVGYGMPRVGNQEFADFVDAHVLDLTHVNNKKDLVPIIPGRFLGFVHPKGEVHIQNSGDWVTCSGKLSGMRPLSITDTRKKVRITNPIYVALEMFPISLKEIYLITTGHTTSSRWDAETRTSFL